MSSRWLARTRLVIVAAVAAAVASAAPRSTQAQSEQFVVIVNASNPATAIEKVELAKLFTKKSRAWPSGAQAQPVDQSVNSSIRDAFTQRVHGKSARAMGSYWQQQIFSGREVPPPERKTDDEVLAFVRSNPGAVGYVAAGTKLGPGVKTLSIAAR